MNPPQIELPEDEPLSTSSYRIQIDPEVAGQFSQVEEAIIQEQSNPATGLLIPSQLYQLLSEPRLALTPAASSESFLMDIRANQNPKRCYSQAMEESLPRILAQGGLRLIPGLTVDQFEDLNSQNEQKIEELSIEIITAKDEKEQELDQYDKCEELDFMSAQHQKPTVCCRVVGGNFEFSTRRNKDVLNAAVTCLFLVDDVVPILKEFKKIVKKHATSEEMPFLFQEQYGRDQTIGFFKRLVRVVQNQQISKSALVSHLLKKSTVEAITQMLICMTVSEELIQQSLDQSLAMLMVAFGLSVYSGDSPNSYVIADAENQVQLELVVGSDSTKVLLTQSREEVLEEIKKQLSEAIAKGDTLAPSQQQLLTGLPLDKHPLSRAYQFLSEISNFNLHEARERLQGRLKEVVLYKPPSLEQVKQGKIEMLLSKTRAQVQSARLKLAQPVKKQAKMWQKMM